VRGIPAILDQLRRLGHPMAVATNSRKPRTMQNLDVTGLRGFFGNHIATVDQVAKGKPAPDVYLLAANMLGHEPAACIAIEDSPPGMNAAVAAGMTAIGYAPPDHGARLADDLRNSGANIIIGDMAELENAITLAAALRNKAT
jgi:beta-phosphoglucomutase-like phosphatase (HAD superfamily)